MKPSSPSFTVAIASLVTAIVGLTWAYEEGLHSLRTTRSLGDLAALSVSLRDIKIKASLEKLYSAREQTVLFEAALVLLCRGALERVDPNSSFPLSSCAPVHKSNLKDQIVAVPSIAMPYSYTGHVRVDAYQKGVEKHKRQEVQAIATPSSELRPTPLTPSYASLSVPESSISQATSGELSAEVKTVVKGNNAFALDLYSQLRNQEGNLFFSPYSISTALAMTYAGAKGKTATEMAKVLHFTLEQTRLHPAFATLIAGLKASDQQGPQISVANRLWGQKGYGFLDSFLKTTQKHYGAGLEEVDFASATEQTRTTINKWVEQNTQQKIQNLIPEGKLDPDTRLVLTNAIYFKGNWLSQFNPKDTKNQPFSITANQQVNVPMMYQEAALRYANLGSLQMLELPYEDRQSDNGPRLSMVILLPTEVDGLAKLEQQLTPENLENWLSSLLNNGQDKGNIKIWLPKFKVTLGLELSDVLSKMGMAVAFSGSADFSGMTHRKDLSISNVIHKAFVDVNELGTEAAAATGIILATRGGHGNFRADHPFIFLIRDIQSDSILFLGRVVQPLDSPVADPK